MSQRQETRHVIAILLLTVFFVLSARAIGQEPQALSSDSRIPLANVKGRIDHFGVDVKGQRLFVAAVANHTLEVIDVQSGKRVHTIMDLGEPQGGRHIHKSFVRCLCTRWNHENLRWQHLRLLNTAKFPDDADNIRYDFRSKGIIVGYAGARVLTRLSVA